jgi:hypothetical protein
MEEKPPKKNRPPHHAGSPPVKLMRPGNDLLIPCAKAPQPPAAQTALPDSKVRAPCSMRYRAGRDHGRGHRKLDGGPLHKSSGRHDHLTNRTGHVPRLGRDIGIDGAPSSECLADLLSGSGAPKRIICMISCRTRPSGIGFHSRAIP